MKKIFAGAAAAALCAVGLALSPVASADADSYIADLNQAGFTGPVDQALAVGYAVCDGVAAGWNQDELIAGVYANTGSTVDAGEAQFLVESAEIFLC